MKVHFREKHPDLSTLDPFEYCEVTMVAKIDVSNWNAEVFEKLKNLLIEWDMKLKPQLLSFSSNIRNFPRNFKLKPGFNLSLSQIVNANKMYSYNRLRLAHNLIEIPVSITNSNGKTFKIKPVSSADQGIYLLKCRFCQYIKVYAATKSFCEEFMYRYFSYGVGKFQNRSECYKEHFRNEHTEKIVADFTISDHFSMILLEKRNPKNAMPDYKLVKMWQNRLNKGTNTFNFSPIVSDSIVQNVSQTSTSSNSAKSPRILMLTGKRSNKITSYFGISTDCDLVESKKRKNEECQESAPKSKKSRKNSIVID